jgi:hypothetical protein
MRESALGILELPLAERAEMALKAAVDRVIQERARQGLPIFVWREGKVVELSAEELRLRMDPR